MDKCNNCTKYNDCKESGFVPCCGAYVPTHAPKHPLIDELTAWRALGPSPEAVAERLRELQAGYDRLKNFEQGQYAKPLILLAQAKEQVRDLTISLVATMADLRLAAECSICAHSHSNGGKCHGGCRRLAGSEYTYEWRGVEAALAAGEEEQNDE